MSADRLALINRFTFKLALLRAFYYDSLWEGKEKNKQHHEHRRDIIDEDIVINDDAGRRR